MVEKSPAISLPHVTEIRQPQDAPGVIPGVIRRRRGARPFAVRSHQQTREAGKGQSATFASTHVAGLSRHQKWNR